MALDYILDLFTGIVSGMRVFPQRMMANIESTHGVIFSQQVMLALVEAGMSREDAYRLAQRHAATAWEHGEDFRELIAADADVRSRLSADQVAAMFDYGYYTRNIDALFQRTSIESVSKSSREQSRATA